MSLTSFDKLLKSTIVCLFLLLTGSVFSQDLIHESSINKDILTEKEILKNTNEFITRKQYDKAAALLNNNYNDFSESSDVNWLYAHVLFMINDNKKADEKFKKAISLSPSDRRIQMDYARFLYELGKINYAEAVLNNLMDDDADDTEFLMMQAQINYWNGDIKNAQKKIDRIQKLSPNTKITEALSEQVEQYAAFYVKANYEFQSDSQPLNYFAPHIVLGKNISPFLNPQLEISQYTFSPQKENASIIKLRNKFRFNKIKLNIEITGGIYTNYSTGSDWVGGINLTKKLFRNTSLHFGYAKNSLLSTIASTKFNLTAQDVFGEVNYNNKYIIFQGGYYYQFFKDENYIKSIATYIISQPIKIQNFNFQFGYAYSFTDAKDILFAYDYNGIGVYDPYFTPNEQEINSALFISAYKPIEKITLQAKITYGLKATIRNPYPIELTANNFEIGGFYNETYTPKEFNGSINYAFSKSFSINANYIYQETYFYNRNNINLGLNYIF